MSRLWGQFRRWPIAGQVLVALAVVLVCLALVAALTSASDGDTTTQPVPRGDRPAVTVPTTVTSTTAVALPGGIVPLTIADAHPEGYSRDLFGDGWIDADHDCQDTRAEVLITESSIPVSLSPNGCAVVSGEWTDPWSGTVSTSAAALDVDHTVALANAWRSGAWAWNEQQRLVYANELAAAEHLIAIPSGENRSKSDDGPEAWKPPDPGSWCRYAQVWTAIKARWNLTATPAEWAALLDMAGTC